MDFETDVPVTAGPNVIQIVVRESTDAQSSQTLVVLRK
jgi:hypothetical protein